MRMLLGWLLLSMAVSMSLGKPEKCRDFSSKCQEWALEGDCIRDRAYMDQFCRDSCHPDCLVRRNLLKPSQRVNWPTPPPNSPPVITQASPAKEWWGRAAAAAVAANFLSSSSSSSSLSSSSASASSSSAASPGTAVAIEKALPAANSVILSTQERHPSKPTAARIVSSALQRSHSLPPQIIVNPHNIAAQPADCVNKHTVCDNWAAKGECELYPELMRQVCPASCIPACKAQPRKPPPPQPPPQQPTPQLPPQPQRPQTTALLSAYLQPPPQHQQIPPPPQPQLRPQPQQPPPQHYQQYPPRGAGPGQHYQPQSRGQQSRRSGAAPPAIPPQYIIDYFAEKAVDAAADEGAVRGSSFYPRQPQPRLAAPQQSQGSYYPRDGRRPPYHPARGEPRSGSSIVPPRSYPHPPLRASQLRSSQLASSAQSRGRSQSQRSAYPQSRAVDRYPQRGYPSSSRAYEDSRGFAAEGDYDDAEGDYYEAEYKSVAEPSRSYEAFPAQPPHSLPFPDDDDLLQ